MAENCRCEWWTLVTKPGTLTPLTPLPAITQAGRVRVLVGEGARGVETRIPGSSRQCHHLLAWLCLVRSCSHADESADAKAAATQSAFSVRRHCCAESRGGVRCGEHVECMWSLTTVLLLSVLLTPPSSLLPYRLRCHSSFRTTQNAPAESMYRSSTRCCTVPAGT